MSSDSGSSRPTPSPSVHPAPFSPRAAAASGSGTWLAGLIAAAVLSACGGGGSGAPNPTPVADDTRADALSASQPGELLAYVREKTRARLARAVEFALNNPATPAPAPVTTAAPSPASVAADSSARSGTTVQEAGVDEADLIKWLGDRVVTVDSLAVTQGQANNPIVNTHALASDGRLQAVGSLALPGNVQRWSRVSGLLAASSGRHAAVLGEVVEPFAGCLGPAAGGAALTTVPCIPAGDTPSILPFPGIQRSNVRVQGVRFDASGVPSAGTRLDISGNWVGVRQIGDTLYLVSTHSPRLAVEALPVSTPAAERNAAIDRISLQEVLPTVRVDGGEAQPLLADSDCYLQGANASDAIEVTTITMLNLADTSLPRRSRCILGGSEAVYLSTQSLVLATTRYGYSGNGSATTPWRYPAEFTTDLHRFALANGTVDYRASGSVKGHLGWDANRKSYRISEHNGDLRVLSFTGDIGWAVASDSSRSAASPATLTVLREQAGATAQARSLQTLATLPNAQRPAPLGRPGEQVYGVRFLGDRGYLVTFRVVDPLYVLDLSNPSDPRVAGELEVPGFSNDLYPLPGGLLLGIGRDVNAQTGLMGGVKLSLFDVANPATPKELSTRTLGQRGSFSGLDFSPQGINMLGLSDTVRVALPMALVGASGVLQAQGLQPFEVDLRRRTLVDKPLLPGAGEPSIGIALDRSLQVGDRLLYLRQGRLSASAW
jgi:hypothetical protein